MRATVIAVLVVLLVFSVIGQLAGMMPPPAEADEQGVTGFRLKLQPPDGYCALEAAQTEDAVAIQMIQRKLPSTLRVVFAYASCPERERLRQGDRAAALTIGAISIGQNDDKPNIMPAINRADYLARVIGLDQKAGSSPAGTGDSPTKILEDRGLPPTDRNAHYIGGLFAQRAEGGAYRQMAYINALTEIDSVPLVIGFSHPIDQGYGVDDLYGLQTGYVSKLIAINQANEDSNLTNVGGALTYKAPLRMADVLMPVCVIGLIAIFIFWRPKPETLRGAAIGASEPNTENKRAG